MKTQFHHLINGSKNVIRDLSHPKYQTANKSTSFGEFAGSNTDERTQLAEKIFSENPTGIKILIKGVTLVLPIHVSTTGKTKTYTTSLTEEQFMQIAGYKERPFPTYEGSYGITIYSDLMVRLEKFARKTPQHQWKQRGWDNIGEEFITVL